MKVLSVDEARGQFKAICDEALGGEIIRVQLANGSLLELAPVPILPGAWSGQQLEECYDDAEWALFENHCGAASA